MSANVIQVDYEALSEIARRFQREEELVEALRQAVLAGIRPLENGGWQGRGAEAFFAEMHDMVLPVAERLAAALAEASAVVQTISAVYQAAEEEAAAPFGGEAETLATGTGRGLSLWEKLLSNPNLPAVLFEPSQLFLDIMQALVSNRGNTRALFKEMGRLLNAITGQQGHVGLMDKAYDFLVAHGVPYRGTIDKLLNSSIFERGLVAADAVFGFFDDMNKGTYGDDYLKAGGVNAIDSLIQFGIMKANPYGAAAFIVNGVVQIGGNVQAWTQNQLADMFAVDGEMAALLHHDAGNVATAVARMDLGNITKELSEAIYETGRDRINLMVDSGKLAFEGVNKLWQDPSWQTLMEVSQSGQDFVASHQADFLSMALLGPAAPSSAGWQNLGEAGVATLNVLDGIADWSAATTSSLVNMGANTLAVSVNTSPLVPDSMKQAVTEGAKSFVDFYQTQMDKSIHFIDF